MKTLDELNEDLLRAYSEDNAATIIALYSEAGKRAFEANDIDAGCFYTVQAYVFALQEGHAAADILHARLVEHGREASDSRDSHIGSGQSKE